MTYTRFLAMIAATTILMYALMYLNVFVVDHIWFSQTRLWMALIMGAAMAVVMLAFMWGMFANSRLNIAIVTGGAAVFLLSLWLVRSQRTVSDVAYMKAMIPHHSIAILTSERARLHDPRVRHLADGIIRAQVKEIAEMTALISDLEHNPLSKGAPDIPSYRQRGAPPPKPE